MGKYSTYTEIVISSGKLGRKVRYGCSKRCNKFRRLDGLCNDFENPAAGSLYYRFGECLVQNIIIHIFDKFGFPSLQTFIAPPKLMNNGRHCCIEVYCRFVFLPSDLLVKQIFPSNFSQVFGGFLLFLLMIFQFMNHLID